MNTFRSVAIFVLSLLLTTAFAQNQYTPYDDIPGVIKSYKPAYSNGFPVWAKMLYDYPVNYQQLVREFDRWLAVQEPLKKTPEYRYFRIWQRAVAPYVLNDGTIRLPNLKEYEHRLRRAQTEAGKVVAKEAGRESNWSFLGPKETFWLNESGSPDPPDACPWQVNVYSFDVSATDENILYCGTETGFVNKTTDKGETWQLMAPDYYFGGSVTAVAIHPNNPDVVYVAAGSQIHKTLDAGVTWIPLLPDDNLFHADRLRIDAANPDKIFAAASDGVYVSFDGGNTWQNKWGHQAYDVEVKTDDDEVVVALTDLNGKFAIVISSNGGQNFSVQPSFPSDIVNQSGGLLAVTPDNPDKIVAVMLSANNTPYLYQESFSGNTWELLATGNTEAFAMNNGQGYFDLVLDLSPDDANTIFVGTTTLFKSINGGQTFTVIGGYYGNFNIHPDDQDIKLLTDGEAWISTDGGFSLSSDNFTSVHNYVALNNGLVGSDMWGFHQGWSEDLVVGGRYHNGNTAIADFYQPKALRMGGAESPTGWVLQGRSRYAAFNDLGNGWILPPDAESKPEGRFIFSKYPNMDEYGGRRGNMVFHPNYYGTIYLGEGNDFWRSTDMGVSFDLLHNFNARVRYLEISYSNPNVIYADVVGKGLFRTEDGGETWQLKPSLTSGQYGNSYWKGRLFIAVSPYDENVIYACLQNGMWSTDIGKVFKSTDGGDTWQNWTGSLSEHTKCLVLQPDGNGSEWVYLFTNAANGQPARVYVRGQQMDDWESFDDNYPAGMQVNMAMPFYRDSKIRVGGTGGVWESPMETVDYDPVVNPWVGKAFYNCMLDTLYFNDHSLMDYEGVSWHWEITPEPAYISNPDIRNPKVVLGAPGSYDVRLSVDKNGQEYTKLVPGMVTTTTCPSIDDCSNPAYVPKDVWSLVYVDSEETNYPGYAVMSFDDDPSTIWHTRWSTGNDPYPHEIQVDMGQEYKIFKFTYLNRQDGENGRIKDYKLYISDDLQDWGAPVSIGQFVNTAAPQTVVLDSAVIGQYFRLLALSEVNGNPWASAAEFYVTGCTDITGVHGLCEENKTLRAFPVPATGEVQVSLPEGNGFVYRLISLDGRVVQQGVIKDASGSYVFDLSTFTPGVYFVHLISLRGVTYKVKLVKK